jgi:sugar phosphate isomerase/epimerase
MPLPLAGFADEAGKTLKEQIAAIKDAGWTAFEARNIDGKNLCDFSDSEFFAVVDTLQSNNIKLIGLGSRIANWGRPINTEFQVDVDELKRNAARMKKVGCNLIRIMSYPNRKENPLPEAEWKAETLKRIKELAKIAEDAGIIMVHENCDGWASQSPENALEMLRVVNSPALKLVFDTGNQSAKKKDAAATWSYYEKVREHVVHVHIKATKADEKGNFVHCYPDEEPTVLQIVKDLKSRGYKGYWSIEPHLEVQVHADPNIPDVGRAAWVWGQYARRTEKLISQA